MPTQFSAEPADGAAILPDPNPNRAAAAARQEGQRQCSTSVVAALGAKSFVILTGASGTGKSRAALALSAATQELLLGNDDSSNFALVPVGSGWTDTRHILGYRNPFGPPRETADGVTNETYSIPDSLRLLLKAAHPDREHVPHFLILDEMNLSHVERYFSPFLSLMEARRAEGIASPPIIGADEVRLIAEVLEDENPDTVEADAARLLSDQQTGLPLLPNLFIVGTVNVDETTYMFSPKVLDRAHVIEMRPVVPSSYISQDVPEADDEDEIVPAHISGPLAAAFMDGVVRLREDGLLDRRHPAEIMAAIAEDFSLAGDTAEQIDRSLSVLLDGAFRLLEPVGFAFGYRTVNEVYGYLYSWLGLMQQVFEEQDFEAIWPTALDNLFVQKILPKIHGNRRQLSGSLNALEAFLRGNDRDGDPPARYQSGEAPEVVIEPEERLLLPPEDQMNKSRRKLLEMQRQLAATGYVSFVQ